MLDFILELAEQAGRLVLEGAEKLTASQIRAKGTPTDLVTEVDRSVEEFLIREIRKRFPDHGVFGEETGISGTPGRFRWVIDPIDGTVNFIHGFPFFAVSIAFQENGETEAGVVAAPMLKETFAARRGGGATCNGRSLRASGCTELGRALLATGFACVRAGKRPDNLDILPGIVRSIRGIRRTGSAALDLCYVAAGRLDGYWESDLNLYDVAAGALIATEAGAVVTDFSGGARWPEQGTAAGSPELLAALLPRIGGGRS